MTKLSAPAATYTSEGKRTAWKFCPPTLRSWESFYQRGFMALNTPKGQVGDLTQYSKPSALAQAAGMAPQTAHIQSLQHFRDAAIGDIVIAAKGRSTVLGIGIITGPYTFEARKGDYPHIRKVDWVITTALPIKGSKLPGRYFAPLASWSHIQDTYKQRFPELTATLAELEMPLQTTQLEDPDQFLYNRYSREDALKDLFLEEEEFDQIQTVLARKKNLILQGPPGVGKTFIASRLAFAQTGYQDRSRIEWVQLHPSYAYEDFVQGIRPGPKGGFERVDGIFYQFCEKARKDPIRPYYFILDEINRGNLSSILGELFMLLESDKRKASYAIPLTYAQNAMERFYIPPNLYIIGTMNTADRSLAPLDYALRRRFAFVDLKPQYGKKFQAHLRSMGLGDDLIQQIVSRISQLNAHIRQHAYLGAGFEIGHSFFCHLEGGEPEESWYKMIIDTEIVPLLRAYWPDEPEQVEQWKKVLLG